MFNEITRVDLDRRKLIFAGAAVSEAFAMSGLRAQKAEKPDSVTQVRPEPKRGQRQDLDLVKAFVGAGHNDKNLARVKELLDRDPKLVFAAHDWGGGDWETALGGASHTGSREMARYLLARGARIDSFCAAMLAERDVLAALVLANPPVVTTKGPHGYTLLYHVAIGGDVIMAELLEPHLGNEAAIYTQALSAAVRDGHLPMIRWLFEHGPADPNVPDVFGKRPLTVAMEKGFQEMAEELQAWRQAGRKLKPCLPWGAAPLS